MGTLRVSGRTGLFGPGEFSFLIELWLLDFQNCFSFSGVEFLGISSQFFWIIIWGNFPLISDRLGFWLLWEQCSL